MPLLLNMYQVILNSVRLLPRSAANGLANNEKPFSLFLNSSNPTFNSYESFFKTPEDTDL